MRLRAASLDLEAGALSGGNQQKVALAKWLQIRPKLLLLDEPTRGIDIGAKREIYQLMNQWTAQGIAILLITSEMPELLTLSDRIVVSASRSGRRGIVPGASHAGSRSGRRHGSKLVAPVADISKLMTENSQAANR